MLSLSPRQLCDYYLDGNIEAAFEVFEHAGPEGVKLFLGIKDEATWKRIYKVLLKDYRLLEQLYRKYHAYLSHLVEEQGMQTLREILHIEGTEYDTLVHRVFSVWQAAHDLDERFDRSMRDIFHGRQKSQVGVFFTGLRHMLRRDLGL